VKPVRCVQPFDNSASMTYGPTPRGVGLCVVLFTCVALRKRFGNSNRRNPMHDVVRRMSQQTVTTGLVICRTTTRKCARADAGGFAYRQHGLAALTAGIRSNQPACMLRQPEASRNVSGLAPNPEL